MFGYILTFAAGVYFAAPVRKQIRKTVRQIKAGGTPQFLLRLR